MTADNHAPEACAREEPMLTITLGTTNPLDIPPEELDDLALAIRSLDPAYRVEITAGDQRGVAVTWWEVITCHVPWTDLTTAAAAALMREIISWLRNRFKKVPRRPKSLTIYGSNGEVLKRVVLKSPNEDPMDRT